MDDASNMTANVATVRAAGNITAGAGPEAPAWKGHLVDYAISHAGALLTALLIVIVGFMVARTLGRLAADWLERKKVEPPLRVLLARVLRLVIVGIAIFIAMGTVGIDVTVLIAGVSVAGVGVGLALQGVLGNLVAGMTIIFTKPFRVGDYIEILGVEGQVHTIDLLSTVLVHPDQSRVKIPSRKIIGEVLHNYGSMRRLNLSVGVAYGTNLSEAIALAQRVILANPKVLKEPVPWIGVTELGDSSITISVMPWTKVTDYSSALGELYLAIAETFRANGISIPFPQREVRLLGQS
jgi:small conductance mechanosensitive channel